VFKFFCWFLDGSRDPFSVEIGASKIVDDLKNEIGKHNSVNLWKVGSF
jgi:Crinkler effector protein N-terminal domain